MLMLFMPLATFAQKFGHVNAQEIMASMPEFIKARGEVEAAAKQYDNDLKAMQDELQRKAQDYDKNSSTMNETKKKETEESLQQMYQKIQQTAQDNQQALGKLQQDKIGPITNKLVDAIKAVGKAETRCSPCHSWSAPLPRWTRCCPCPVRHTAGRSPRRSDGG